MIQYHNESFRNYLRHMEVFETIVSGDVYDIPFGAIQAAVGYQWRNNVDETIPEGHQTSRQGFDYVRAPMNSPIPEYERYESEVHAYFLEIQAPLWETVDAQFAVRHEVFDSFKLKTTTPKVSLRWEALPSLAFRASWGESFLAPSARDARPFVPNQSSDRITSLSYVDTAQLQYTQMLSATSQTNASYDPTPGSATRNAADAWLSTLGIAGATSNKISRYSNGLIEKIYRQPANITSTWIDVYDLNTSYTTEINDLGTFSFSVAATYYDRYEYEGLNGGVKSALGKQNSNSGIVPPLPELKSNVRLSWFRDNQRASISTNHWSSVDFDARIVDYYADIRQTPLTAPKEIKGEYITNVRYAIELDDVWGQNITVSAGVNNLTDKRPQLMGILGGFESRLSNPWGRSYWVSMEWTTE
jgi:iron complex outermembrane receptor protein